MSVSHDDVIKWKHFPRNWPFVQGIHRLPVNSPHKGQWRRALMLSLICTWTNGWVNNRDAGDFRRHRTHYDVILMKKGVSNHRRMQCLPNCWFRRRSKKTSKLRVIGLCVANSLVTGEFPAQKASNAEYVPIWWHHHAYEMIEYVSLSHAAKCTLLLIPRFTFQSR